jgi:hypothetical protein
MDPVDLGVMIALNGPFYAGLAVIYIKLGRFDRVVKEFDRLRDQHDAVMIKGGHH